jgi:hypothetical protein
LQDTDIHKYTHKNHKLSALNIKYYKFWFKFRCNIVLQWKLHVDAEAILNNTRATPYPKVPPSEVVNAYGVSQYISQYGPTIESGPLTGIRRSASSKGREELPAHS